jgi:transposase
MRTLGIDLGVTAAHKALVLDEGSGEFVTPLLSFRGRWEEIVRLVTRAREGVEADHPLQVVMEPTGMAWYPVAVALVRLGVTCFLVNGQRIRDLRRFYKRHSSSDRISARVLAQLPRLDRESLHPLRLPSAQELACQRGCKQLDRLQKQMTAIKNRLQDSDRWAWPGLKEVLPDPFSAVARRFREQCYDPAGVVAAGVEQLRAVFVDVVSDAEEWRWLEALVQLAQEVLQLYGTDTLDYALLQEEVCREQRLLSQLEQEAQAVQQTVRSLYRQLHPGRELESLPGVGEGGAAVYVSFVRQVERFPTLKQFRGWHGLVPESRQSGERESKGLHISQAGPNLVKKFAYLNADVARQYDPQIAACYYDQMVHKGKHHNQAVCACASHLMDRVYVVLKEGRPYELRDVDGRPVSKQQARQIILEQYIVPEEVRKRNNRRARKERAERRAEEKAKKRSRSRR